MDKTYEALKQEIERLKKENKDLKKDLVMDDGFNFDFIYEAINQPVILLAKEGESDDPQVQKMNKPARDLFSVGETHTYPSPFSLGLFSSKEQYKQINKGLKNKQNVSFIGKLVDVNGVQSTSQITLFKRVSGEGSFYLAFFKKLGTQQKVLEALRKSEYRFLQMVENIVEGIVIAEAGKSVFVNTSMVNITGYPKEELIKMNEEALAIDSEKERLKNFIQKTKESNKGLHAIEFWIKTKQGVEKYIRANYTFASEQKSRRNSFMIVSDITSGKKIEQALRKSQKDFKMLADNSPDLITRYNKDLRYSYANKSAARILNSPVDQIVGSNNLELDLEADLVSFIEEMHLEVFRTGRSRKFEFRINKPKRTKVFQSHLVPELTKDKTVSSVLNLARDITQIKEVERKLKAEKSQIIEENKMLGSNLDEWCNKLCEDKPHSVRGEHCMRPIRRISEWIKFANVEEDITLKSQVINSLLKSFYRSSIGKLEEKGLQHELQLPPYEISIYTDETRLINTLDYLLENAIEATTEGKIEIGYDIYNENEVVFFVKDTGCGIDQDDIDAIFNPFVSIGKENKTGLGLNIAQKNVQSMQGEIWCLTAKETGSTFCFTHPAKIEKTLLNEKEDKGKWSDRHIHVVEDNDSNYILMESILEPFGAKITRTIEGKQVIDLVKSDDSIDLILMDIQLPGMNGLDATKEIRKFNTEMPIIAQTAYAMYGDVVKALDAGCNDFIAKPLKIKKLVSMIEKYLG